MKEWSTALPTLVTFAPLLGILALLLLPNQRVVVHRLVAWVSSVLTLALAVCLYAHFDPAASGMQMAVSVPWFTISMPQFQLEWVFHYAMGVDGLSMPLVLLTAVVTVLAVAASRYVRKRLRTYYMLLLLLQTGMLGVFLANNYFLFFVFFEVTLVSLFFLVGLWGYLGREKAANHFLLYNGLGSGFLLISMVGAMVLGRSLQYDEVAKKIEYMLNAPEVHPVLETLSWVTLISLLIAFAIKLPVFPFHSWMLRVHVEAPIPAVMIHSGVLLKMGAYGMIRFGLGWFPDQMREVAGWLAVLGLVNILYGAVLAFVQKELKRVLAYSSVSHMGIILFGLASLNGTGLQGAVFQAVSHGLISALLFFLVGSLYERTRTTELDELGGLAKAMPVFSGILMVAAMALLGLPGLSGFISEFLAFLGLFETRPVLTSVGALGLVLAAAYTLRALLKTTFGPLKARLVAEGDLVPGETVPMLSLTALIVLIGVWPAVLGDPMQETLKVIVSKIGG
ncbi:complex I subunit 4 family protein [Staphylospora marina]|uniref:complex I subunit 4 family protein n=1 Tax=Staphylospora marina TaxID=2490858 RepID=UPI000F5BC014|nr:NADH-quinone oxidoreductase subunit M [Staphylospora marina]